MGPNPLANVLIERPKKSGHGAMQRREENVMTDMENTMGRKLEAKIRVTCLQGKDTEGCQQTSRR